MIELIDTHHHLWDLSLHRYSWCVGVPELHRSFTMGDYVAAASEMRGARLIGAVHIEADVDEPFMVDEMRWILSQAADPAAPTIAAVGCCRPESSEREFRSFLEQFTENTHLKGVRRVLHTQADDLSQFSQFRRNLRLLPTYGLTFDLCVLARQLTVVIELVKACPSVSFILDHCGVPNVKSQILDPWRGDLCELSRLPNVVACKISGLGANTGKNWSSDDLRPFVDHVIACFGHDRICFGSDWPVCLRTGSYAQWVSALRELSKEWSAIDRDKLFHHNAARIYRLKP